MLIGFVQGYEELKWEINKLNMSAASEVSLIFTTQLYSCLFNYNAIVSLTRGKYYNKEFQEGLPR